VDSRHRAGREPRTLSSAPVASSHGEEDPAVRAAADAGDHAGWRDL
jgi:hypothetical protein